MTQIYPSPDRGHSTPANPSSKVDILILGAGWTSTFLLPLLTTLNLTHAATTRTGHDSTIPFTFNPDSQDPTPYQRLPPATTILITFPLKGPQQSSHLTTLYRETHTDKHCHPNWIQLGSTGIFTAPHWNDSDAPYDKSNQRAIAEDELLHILEEKATVLNLAGLWGGERQPRNWLTRVAKGKEDVRGKGALHLVHGRDVARGVVAAHRCFGRVGGKRWILTNLRCYDWWELCMAWGRGVRERERERDGGLRAGVGEGVGLELELEYEKWVGELMVEEGVRALPRGVERLGKVLDGRGFWGRVGVWPEMSLVGGEEGRQESVM